MIKELATGSGRCRVHCKKDKENSASDEQSVHGSQRGSTTNSSYRRCPCLDEAPAAMVRTNSSSSCSRRSAGKPTKRASKLMLITPCTAPNKVRARITLQGSSSLCVVHRLLATVLLWAGMLTKSKWSPGPGVKILGVALTVDDDWVVSAAGSTIGICPDCGRRSRNRHGWSNRRHRNVNCRSTLVCDDGA
ncbi:hypothetical protein FHT86_007358 [Rhizobium sp. BK313]|nr:hypothetical protein [Rhizobium sp. BK313]